MDSPGRQAARPRRHGVAHGRGSPRGALFIGLMCTTQLLASELRGGDTSQFVADVGTPGRHLMWKNKVETTPQGQSPRNQSPTQRRSFTTSVRRVLYSAQLLPMKWKERWLGPANLDRASLRITGMDTYALIAAVLLQVLLGLYGAMDDPDLDNPRVKWPKLQRAMYEAQLALLMCAVLCTTFTMVMFLLSKLYTVTALGMYKDVSYDIFQKRTSGQRVKAFWSLIAGMLSFLMAFSLNLYTKMKGGRGLVLAAIGLCFVVKLVQEWAVVMILADKLIFSS